MGNARKILIIDDDDELRDSLSEQLSLHEEFDTLLAANASDGLKLARNGHGRGVFLYVVYLGGSGLKPSMRSLHIQPTRSDGNGCELACRRSGEAKADRKSVV